MDSQERIRGTVLSWDCDKFFGIVADEDLKEYLALGDDIQGDRYGRQYLSHSDRVLFSPVQRPNGRWRASDVKPINRPIAEPYNPDWREEVTLEHWAGTYGFAKRDFGGRLFISQSAIITEGLETLGPGSRLWLGVKPPSNGKGSWEGFDIQILMPEGAELEPSAAVPETVFGLALQDALSPVNS